MSGAPVPSAHLGRRRSRRGGPGRARGAAATAAPASDRVPAAVEAHVTGAAPRQSQRATAHRQEGLTLVRGLCHVLRRAGLGAHHQQAMHQPAERLAGMDVQPQLAAQALVAGTVAVRHLQPHHRMAAAVLLQLRRPGGRRCAARSPSPSRRSQAPASGPPASNSSQPNRTRCAVRYAATGGQPRTFRRSSAAYRPPTVYCAR